MLLDLTGFCTIESTFFIMRLPKMHSIISWSVFLVMDFGKARLRLTLAF